MFDQECMAVSSVDHYGFRSLPIGRPVWDGGGAVTLLLPSSELQSVCLYAGFGFSSLVLLGRRDFDDDGIEIAQEFPQSFHRDSLVIAMDRGTIHLVC